MEGLNIGNAPLGDHDADWLRVMANASNSSVRVKVASVLGYYVRRRKDEYREIISYTASKYGLTFEECFHKLRKGEPLGDPLDSFDIDPDMENRIESLDADEEQAT